MPAAETEASTAAPGDTRRQERQVRLTAQRILAEHLRATDKHSSRPNPRFWPGISLDLTGATLIDFSFDEGVVEDAWFGGATFTGTALFRQTSFGYGWFTGATFGSHAWFTGANFYDAEFGRAIFTGHANFSEALIGEGDASFNGAFFGGEAIFHEATFYDAEFQAATFTGHADFSEAAFCEGDARFNQATFGHDANFVGRPSTTALGSAWQPSAAAPYSMGRPSAAARTACLSRDHASCHLTLGMSGRRDGAPCLTARAGTCSSARSTTLSARTATVALDLPRRGGRRDQRRPGGLQVTVGIRRGEIASGPGVSTSSW